MVSPRGHGPALRRRRFLALGAAGGAAGLLAACGKQVTEPSSSNDVALLSDALVAETNATSALGDALKLANGADAEPVKELRDQATEYANRLQDQLSKLNATPTGEFSPERADDLDAALNAAVEQTNDAIEAYRSGAGLLTTEELRAEAIELATGDGARLALLRSLLGERDLAPTPFVTGGSRPNIEPDTTSTTSTTSSTSTSTGSGQ
jgi:rubrerythrin